eukprot:comp21685_c0_seq1/m.30551 comp21685_c0_seq1/g.30551  ORF comp21685_c0_seq1/g.30551 comp21685_c0_seq1/m.30551 type:complete len:309 (-) comp21685_c0_seq1:50-976(-)
MTNKNRTFMLQVATKVRRWDALDLRRTIVMGLEEERGANLIVEDEAPDVSLEELLEAVEGEDVGIPFPQTDDGEEDNLRDTEDDVIMQGAKDKKNCVIALGQLDVFFNRDRHYEPHPLLSTDRHACLRHLPLQLQFSLCSADNPQSVPRAQLPVPYSQNIIRYNSAYIRLVGINDNHWVRIVACDKFYGPRDRYDNIIINAGEDSDGKPLYFYANVVLIFKCTGANGKQQNKAFVRYYIDFGQTDAATDCVKMEWETVRVGNARKQRYDVIDVDSILGIFHCIPLPVVPGGKEEFLVNRFANLGHSHV